MSTILYLWPKDWIRYSFIEIVSEIVEAKVALESLRTIPYQRSWVESLQKLELKREVAGTSRIEGADFTDRELEAAMSESAEVSATRSQRQAQAAVKTYRWIGGLPDDLPLDENVIRAIHFRIVTGADDDHCQPGQLRKKDENVTFGTPRHRGVEGGEECTKAFAQFAAVLQREFQSHDPLIRALAAHYHLAAMHPFLDGNGRTARALEALLLQRAGLRDSCFIAMSNYYYDEKTAYLSAMSEVRAREQDLTPFLKFALKGIALQSRRLLAEIKHENAKALFRNLMYDLFSRLKTPRKRVIARRQIEILNILLESEWIEREEFADKVVHLYKGLGNPGKAIIRDLNNLLHLGTIKGRGEGDRQEIGARLEWPTEITATEFFKRLKQLPKAKGQNFFQ